MCAGVKKQRGLHQCGPQWEASGTGFSNFLVCHFQTGSLCGEGSLLTKVWISHIVSRLSPLPDLSQNCCISVFLEIMQSKHISTPPYIYPPCKGPVRINNSVVVVPIILHGYSFSCIFSCLSIGELLKQSINCYSARTV